MSRTSARPSATCSRAAPACARTSRTSPCCCCAATGSARATSPATCGAPTATRGRLGRGRDARLGRGAAARPGGSWRGSPPTPPTAARRRAPRQDRPRPPLRRRAADQGRLSRPGGAQLSASVRMTRSDVPPSHLMGDHLIVMHSAVRALPGYNRHDAPAMFMDGPSITRETELGLAVTAQLTRPHGTQRGAARRGLRARRGTHPEGHPPPGARGLRGLLL